MVLCRKIRVECNFATLKKFNMLKNGIFRELVVLMIFCENLIC